MLSINKKSHILYYVLEKTDLKHELVFNLKIYKN